MISATLRALERGLRIMRDNSRLLLVGILVFVFPLLFLWTTQSFLNTAYSNINTLEKQRINSLHTALAGVVVNLENFETVFAELAKTLAQDSADIKKIRLVEINQDDIRVLFALDTALIGDNIEAQELFRMIPALGGTDSVIYPNTIDGIRTWQVFRLVEHNNRELVLFTEHTFEVIDAVMLARQQQSYFGLSAIFVFLITLAYWLNRQTQWEKNHHILENQLKERDLFSHMIAHEFRSPLTAIKGYASFLEESKELSSDEKRFSTNIRISAERLVVLVNDFLEVAQLQAGKMQIKKTNIDLREVLTRVTEELQPSAQAKDVTLTYEQPVQPIMFTTDSSRMMQVLTNIVSNAVKYTPSGAIELECVKEGHRVVIKVKDTGTGISAEDQKKLFAPFMRVGGVEQTDTTGTGLGMWITKQIVQLLNGTIGVESIRGVGTHVVITFTD